MSTPSIKRELFSVLLRILAVVVTIVLIIGFISVSYSSLGMISDGECNIAVLPIEGIILPYGSSVDYGEFVTTPRDVREFITAAENEIAILGIMFDINSPGGTHVAAETITDLVKNSRLTTVALIGDTGASGGYMIASAADTVIASAMSDVGSIGVTMSYVEESEKNEEDGLTFVELSTGKFKDTGNPNKPLSDEERALLESQLATVQAEFVRIVAENRELDVTAVETLADGSTLIGEKAREAGLVDVIGGRDQAREAFATALSKSPEEIVFCEYYPLLEVI